MSYGLDSPLPALTAEPYSPKELDAWRTVAAVSDTTQGYITARFLSTIDTQNTELAALRGQVAIAKWYADEDALINQRQSAELTELRGQVATLKERFEQVPGEWQTKAIERVAEKKRRTLSATEEQGT